MTKVKSYTDEVIGKNFKPGVKFAVTVSIPEVEAEELALHIVHDNEVGGNVNAMVKLADEGKAPYCLIIAVDGGWLPMHDGSQRRMRMNCYDLFSREFSDFLIYELVPYVTEKYAVKISESPDMHLISGSSSGGISSLAAAFFHPEYFHRVYMGSPSFLAMGRGNELPYLFRKHETKPLRIYEEWSENEPSDYFGGIGGIASEINDGLKFAGYDFTSEFFPDEGHSSRWTDEEDCYKRYEWLWRDYKTTPVKAPANSPRVDKVIPFGTYWESCDTFPGKRSSALPWELEIYDNATASADGLAYYGADENDDIVYMHPKGEKISTDTRLTHATLHTLPTVYPKGAIAMDVDAVDRLYVLTRMGIQCVRSYGLIDVILDLPDESSPLDIAITDALYLKTEKGIYRRALQPDCTDFEHPTRKYASYYD